MKILLTITAITMSSALFAGERPPDIIDARIGMKIPTKYISAGSDMGTFTFTRLPVLDESIAKQVPDVNFFAETSTSIVAGFRGDRAMSSFEACTVAAKQINEDLKKYYPEPYQGWDPRFKLQSKDGKIIAGARCSVAKVVDTLTLEVIDPILEETLSSKARGER